MSKFQDILKSFNIKDTLNPKVWENADEPEKAKMKSEVQKALEKIADNFIEYLGDDVFVQDVILTGSLANFNWSEFSDFDLHIIIEFDEYGKNKDLYKDLFDLKKFVFNNSHDIKIYGYDVELYAQDEKESHYASGVYSLTNKEWVKIPKKEKFDLDQNVLSEKIKCWVEKIERAIKTSETDDDKDILDKAKDKLKEYRKSGLEKDGELSYENLVFKFLRRSGHIEKLFDLKNKILDKQLSVERIVNEEIGTSIHSVVSNSKFLKELMELVKDKMTLEFSPSRKPTYDERVKKIQEALQILGHLPSGHGVDGKFGEETKSAVESFQEKYRIPKTGRITPSVLKFLIAALVVKKFRDSELSSVKYRKTDSDENFSFFDLNNSDEFERYAEICQKFIDSRNPNSEITGKMMAECAKEYASQGYVPPELALAQLTLEGGLSKDTNAKPIKTKNPFNIGNTDSGKLNYRPSFEDGVCLYYSLMARGYLSKGATASDLLQNFVNTKGMRYASNRNYEKDLQSLVSSVKKVTQATP